MSMPSPVLWGEGVFLRPQHFQQQDRYHEAILHQTARALYPYGWGVRRLAIDLDLLRSEVLRFHELALLFPDGEVVCAPGGDALPPPLRLTDLAEAGSCTFHAVLPALRLHGGNCDNDTDTTQGDARYLRHDAATADLYTQAAEAPISYRHKRLRIVPDSQAQGGVDSVPLVRLRRVASGGFEIDPAFVPPSLTLDAGPCPGADLYSMLARLSEKLLAKVNALYTELREPQRNTVDVRASDASVFWLLHTASSGYAALAHFLHHRELHPERLYCALLSLAGALMTFSRSHRLEQLPPYLHADPAPAFARLDGIIRDLLDTVISARYFTITLHRDRPSYYLGALDSGRINAGTALYLAVAASLPAVKLIELVPLQFKVGSPEDVDRFVLSALPGVQLQHAPQVPAAIPVRPDTYYFVLENRSMHYDAMLKAQAISIYVPGAQGGATFQDLRLELIAVLP